jgi:hypothetical protein
VRGTIALLKDDALVTSRIWQVYMVQSTIAAPALAADLSNISYFAELLFGWLGDKP